ncbi:glutaredoxin family protein [Hyalangium rubrum]|uniref:Glutaredoxin family protein n=1 Tax=Hyalangium rubrum TaxID=3103134 RepID=A0ABU5HBB8_9BACT|nr:glutaredoxin family protein [Hyalangium sp. s54d21]MDY7230765.1 glutaredoxin family protein [Hyalangium sp. s54d21]
MKVDIYSKPACSLCDEAIAVVERVRARIPFELRIISILEDPAALQAWRYDIPVVFINDELAFKHRVEEAAVEAWLLRGKDGTGVAPQGSREE